MLRQGAACLGFVDLWDILGMSAAWTKAGCLCGKDVEIGLGLCMIWVG